MKRLIVLFFAVLIAVSMHAQFALKGGVVYADKELSNAVVTGQFYKDLLVVSGDLYIPTRECRKVSGGGRIGLGFGSYRVRVAGDLGAMYENDEWRCGFGAELNLRLAGPVGIFGRFNRSFPISKVDDRRKIMWCNGRSDFSVGIVIDFGRRRCYWTSPFLIRKKIYSRNEVDLFTNTYLIFGKLNSIIIYILSCFVNFLKK